MVTEGSSGEIGQPFSLTRKERAELKLFTVTELDPRVAAFGFNQMVANHHKGGEFELTDEQLFDITLAGIQAQQAQERRREEQLAELKREHEEYLVRIGF